VEKGAAENLFGL